MPTTNDASFHAHVRISAIILLVFAASILQAQVRIVTAVPARPNRPLNIPPSVTSIENHMAPFAPNVPASVTSISPYNFNTQPYVNVPVYPYPYGNGGRYNRCRGRGCNVGYGGYGGYGYGYSYAVPYYYYPLDDPGDYGSGSSGPYLYSGPLQGSTPPAAQTLHIIVDSAPVRPAPRDEIAEQQSVAPAPSIPDAKPGVPTILVFRDGHKQDVTNYAIMGPTVYVFDNRTKKIALADLDIPATVKANDDQGVEFQVPKAKPTAKPAKSGVPLQSMPDESPKQSTSSMTATP